jgi:hypothetical protein
MLNGPPLASWPAPCCANQGKRLVNDGRRPRLDRNASPIPGGVGGLVGRLHGANRMPTKIDTRMFLRHTG